MFDKIKKALADNSEIIELSLSEYFSDYPLSLTLDEAQKYSLLGGGKRIRAFLVLEFCRILGGNVEDALPYACAIEMMHASSLVHDDMPCMDNDDFRRGKPSTHKRFSETAALLTGDTLIIKAFSVISENHHLDDTTNLKAIKILSSASGDVGMLGGQAIDTLSSKYVHNIDNLICLHSLKTGKLIAASAMLGCLAAGIAEDDKRYDMAINYAENLGLSFQIRDDILDHLSGKTEYNSFLSFMSLEDSIAFADTVTNKAIESIKSFDDGGLLEELAKFLKDREY